jgi:hypothetical protein
VCCTVPRVWSVRYLREAEDELAALPGVERAAMINADKKLREFGPHLGTPHTSAVRGVRGSLRELRPRGGRSPWRGLYRRVGQEFVIAAVGPEAKADRRGFDRAVRQALDRLAKVEG